MVYEKSVLLGVMGIGGQEMLLIVLACLLLFGGKKIPELMRGLGRGVREFKRGQEEEPQPEGDKTDKGSNEEGRP
ncbi:twin-arginine translocase TatA/TatE family subunit [Parapedobacter indicus]|uniref:Sec-independent protein translocase protein TatA n=1 Tax=Parapedobacter indicus TaxID=1477437 RepID=A0A1I3KGT9_9SPHI|nr:twin-arginine translocase TatA/TatE family subunit [Parapedobacter indicus]PPL01819.1 sec-independent protein translocase protein TatA [Parapedobacter indicus]SFI71696.1 sec-independent protein translocase protein TatA [Parapedobacter indicus]